MAGPFTLTWDFEPDPLIEDQMTPPLAGKLGCSQHVAYIQSKCQGPRLCELEVSTLNYDRRLDDISRAVVEVAISGDMDTPCCSCLGDIEPWCHVLTIVREGDGVVWTGPVRKITYGYDSATIEASDKLGWLEVRINEIPINQFLEPVRNTTVPLTEIAKLVIEIGMSDDSDSPCFMECVLADPDDGFPVGAERTPNFPAFEGPTVYDDLLKLANGGVDFTVVNQCLIITSEKLPAVAIGTLLDEHILGEISVIKDGDLLANRLYVRYEGDEDPATCGAQFTPSPGLPTCAGPAYTECTPCPAVSDPIDQECYGLVERIINPGGLYTVEMARQSANTFLNSSKIVPRRIEFPSGTRLSPETPWELNDMIPGQRIDVSLSKLCLPIFQSFKLQQVSVVDGPDGEEISIDLIALTTG